MKVETDPHGRDPHELGAKLDADKVPLRKGCLDQFPMALEAIALVSAFGAEKYTWGGWLTVSNGIERYLDAAARHAQVRALGHTYDEFSRLRHLAHEAWNILAALELEIREQNKQSIAQIESPLRDKFGNGPHRDAQKRSKDAS